MNTMKRVLCSLLVLWSFSVAFGQEVAKISSPNGKLQVQLFLELGKPCYTVRLGDKMMLEKSPLGIRGSESDLSALLQLVAHEQRQIDEVYQEAKIKASHVHYQANELSCTFMNSKEQHLVIVFRVSNNDVAFRYHIPQVGESANLIIEEELSGFKFPTFTTTFLTPQAPPMSGWMKTKPSYEEEYVADEVLGTPSKYGIGYTFPALFHVGDRGWVLLSETGVNALYCGSKLSEGTRDGLYRVAFPEAGENNGIGRPNPTIALPGYTPWRTITVGESLKPIVETTVPFDLVTPQYKASKDYRFGRATWSWLEWQDGSINMEDQKKFIDLSATMGYEFTLIDNWWDAKIGHDKIEDLVQYGKNKGVGICLWYNSNGFWNDAPQSPKNRMSTAPARKKEMEWMQRIGVKGIKVDFFGGDKQETMKLYEDILADANDHGLAVIFHGCTLPRGWERMYPNFAGSEAVLASENLIFTQHANDTEAYNATLHPFIRNTVASMDFGPVLLNKRHNRGNNAGTERKTTETFQAATAVVFQTPLQNFGITPNNLTDATPHIVEFMKEVPTTWDETVLLDGYPGKYVVLARRHAATWYIAAINAEAAAKEIQITLPMLKDKSVRLYSDNKARVAEKKNVFLLNNNQVKLTIPSGGAAVIVGQ
ncbi:glycoside hydrolase family 97 protein [Sphingobacterium griseoflavum]|uniref:Alpha-glucosidase n=1 Tax=Sphingobacterium griseoflavum TaxID=1474952 RepID=A0ABQ3HZU4_9SPHI|nr:glycoside hydrolase family 97 protein [Sphingobacterium griseoflavum]GHE39653.1 alpha-glucosidase [Sphingobacterium griseoflavum]